MANIDLLPLSLLAFVEHDSHSVQHSLHAVGAAVLAEHETIAEITIALPNKHH